MVVPIISASKHGFASDMLSLTDGIILLEMQGDINADGLGCVSWWSEEAEEV